MALLWRKRSASEREADRAAAEVMRPLPLRWALMLGLFLLMGALWWQHFDKRLQDIEAESSFWDESKTWSRSDRRELAAAARQFREHWGIQVIGHVRTGPLELPELKGSVLFLGVAPARDEALLVVQGLAARTLKAESARRGYDVRLELEGNLARCVQNTPSKDCLLQTMDALNVLFTSS